MKSIPNLIFLKTRQIIYCALGFADSRVLNQHALVSVLAYHSISNDNWRFSVNPSAIKKHISYLKKNYQFVSLNTLDKLVRGKIEVSKPSIVLTFDDGYKDVLKLKDYFKKQNIKPAIFLIADTNNVNEREIGIKSTYLNKREIKSLITAGWEIGCHSNTHANLQKLSTSRLREEIIIAKKNLEKALGIKIKYFAYPKGKYSKEVLRLVDAAGFRLGLTMDDGFIKKGANPLTLPRIGVDRTHTFSEFKTAFSPSTIRFRRLLKSTFIGRYL